MYRATLTGFCALGLIVSVFQRQAQPSPPQIIPVEKVSYLQFHLAGGAGRRLRGDWEPSDLLVFSFTGHWPQALADLIASSQADLQVRVLVDRETPDDIVLGWVEEHALMDDRFDLVWTDIDTPWIRDYGPIETVDPSGTPIWLDAEYDVSRPGDDGVPRALAGLFDVVLEPLNVDLDGGALVSNGEGLCISTFDYFVDHGIDAEEVEVRNPLMAALGCQSLVLVPALIDEETKHADMFAQFLSAHVVAVAEIDPLESEMDAERMDVAAHAISEAARTAGTELQVVRVPLPRLGPGEYRTYLNGLRLRGRFLAPSYEDVSKDVEAEAYLRLSRAMPHIQVVPIAADEMIRLAGALHCVSLGLALPTLRGM
jgi:agmatine/peptidylarginine deiminase